MIYISNRKEKEKEKSISREQWQSMVDPPKLMSNDAPNLKWWFLSLLQMVSLFQAQA